MENILFKDFGTFLNTSKGEQYEIKKVIIFKDNQEKIIANYFLDNFREYQFEINGEINRKLKKDLGTSTNFVIKSEEQSSWNDRTQYNLYINGDLNNYELIGLALEGTQLNIKYILNGFNCSHCIGWNQKESNDLKYHKYEEIYKKLDMYRIGDKDFEDNLKELQKIYKKYVKALEEEKAYTEKDYKKMQLSSGTTEEENKTMLKNNGFEI